MVAAVASGITWLTGGAVAGTAATVAASVALYAGTTAASYFIQQANQPKQDVGTKLSAQSGGAVNQSIIVGEKETAGSFIYAGSWGKPGKTPNGFYVRVFCLQDMPSSDFLSRIWTSGNKGTIDLDHIGYTDKDTDQLFPADGSGYTGSGTSMGHPVTTLDHDGNHYAWVKFLDGSQVAADPYLMEKFGGLADRPWKTSMIGRDRTLMIVTQQWTNKEANAEKNFVAVVRGMKLYDWRKDSTNGGSGSHRWGDASTYDYTENSIVILYNIMRGIYRGNAWLYGGFNWPARRFDNASWTAAANVCDENVSLAGGGTQKRYRMGAEINLGEAPLTVMDRVLATCSGRLVESGGIYKVYAGGIGASVYSFTDDEVIITEPLNGKMFPSREDICNTITGSYCEPNNGGQMKAYKKRTKAEYVDADNGETRSTEMSFDYVRDNRQAQQLAKHALNDNRRFMTKTIALPSIARKLEPGDPVNYSNSARFGFTNKKFILGDVTLSNNGVVLGVLREADATDADWSISDEEPYTVGVYGDIVPANQTIDIGVTAWAVKKGDGSDRDPAIKVTWPTDAAMVDCKWVRLQVRYSGVTDPDKYFSVDPVPFDEGKAVITKGVRLTEVYQVRAKIIPYSDRDTDWCDWVEVTANVGHGTSIDEVEDQAPAKMDPPTFEVKTRIADDGPVIQKIKVTFDPFANDKLSYDLLVIDNTTGERDWKHPKDSPFSFTSHAQHNYTIRIRAVSRTGIPGELSDDVPASTFTTPKKSDTDSDVNAPTGFSASGNKAGVIALHWDTPADKDYHHTQIRVINDNSIGPGGANFLDTVTGSSYKHHGLGSNVDRWYFIRHVDNSGNPSAWTPSSAPGEKGSTLKLVSGDIGDGEVKNTNIGTKAVQNGNIDDEAVDTGQIKTKAVKGSKIDDLAVDTTHLKDGSVKSGKIGTGEVKRNNVSQDDADNISTKNLQKGSVTGIKSVPDKFKSAIGGGNKLVHSWKNGKFVTFTNQSGAVEFITISGTITADGKMTPSSGSDKLSISIVVSYKRGSSGKWKDILKKHVDGKKATAGTTTGATVSASLTVDSFVVPGSPKKGSKLFVKAQITWQRATGQSSGVKCAYKSLRIGISNNLR